VRQALGMERLTQYNTCVVLLVLEADFVLKKGYLEV
jgi:hypothetical protein